MRFSKFFMLLATVVTVAFASSCSKDDDDSLSEYQKTHVALDADGYYIVYPKDSFVQYRPLKNNISFYYDYKTNATKYLADTLCYILYDKSQKAIDQELFDKNNKEEKLAFDCDVEFGGYGVKGEASSQLVGAEDASVLTYTYNQPVLNMLYKTVYYYMYDEEGQSAYRICVQGPATTTSFWNLVPEILETFRFKE